MRYLLMLSSFVFFSCQGTLVKNVEQKQLSPQRSIASDCENALTYCGKSINSEFERRNIELIQVTKYTCEWGQYKVKADAVRNNVPEKIKFKVGVNNCEVTDIEFIN